MCSIHSLIRENQVTTKQLKINDKYSTLTPKSGTKYKWVIVQNLLVESEHFLPSKELYPTCLT